MVDLRRKTRLNRGELPVPQVRPRGRARSPARTARHSRAAGYDANGDGVVQRRRLRLRPARGASTIRANGVGPPTAARPAGRPDRLLRRHGRRRQRLRRRHGRLGLPRRRQRPLRRRPVRPRHRRGAATRPPRPTTAASSAPARTAWSIHLRVGDSFVADVNRFAEAVDLRGGQRRARRPGGARHAQQLDVRASSAIKYAYDHGDDGDRLGRRRGRPAPQLAVVATRTRSSSTRSRSTTDAVLAEPAELPAVQRLHELLVADHARDPVRLLLVGRDGPRRRAWPASSTPPRSTRSPAGALEPAPDLPARRRRAVPRHRPTRCAS